MKWKKEILLIILGLVMIRMSSGITANITSFDDGGSAFNITSNYTGYITIPINTTITEANVTLKGINISQLFNTSWCYQESPNASTSCGGLSSGLFTSSSMGIQATDGDWDTYVQSSGGLNYIYVNYTKPIFADNTSLWQVKDGGSMLNLTIPSDCWNYDNNKLVLRMSSYSLDLTHEATWECSNTTGWNTIRLYSNSTFSVGRRLYEEAMWWSNTILPQNVMIQVNNTQVFSHSGNLTSNLSIQLNKTLIQNYVTQQQTIPINFSASIFGMIEISNLIVTYNKTNSAILSILSPSQISQSITSGSGFTQAVNVSNTGNWNATNISFETVSQSATPNLNDSITHDCNNITITGSSSIICNVTFSSLTLSAEPDEKIRVRSLGSDNNDIIYSSGIDLDVTVNAPVQTGSGGGGGGQPSKCEWRVYRPANRVINALGYSGYKTAPISFQVYNNESVPVSFIYFTQGVPCQIEKSTELIQGSSFGLNTIQCDYPIKEDTGQILVLGGACSQSIDVKLSSSELGLGLTYLSGGAGIIPALLLYGIGALALIFTFKFMQ